MAPKLEKIGPSGLPASLRFIFAAIHRTVALPFMPAFALTIFTGAFLLFQVQPLVGKYILPWFGGGPGVWTNRRRGSCY